MHPELGGNYLRAESLGAESGCIRSERSILDLHRSCINPCYPPSAHSLGWRQRSCPSRGFRRSLDCTTQKEQSHTSCTRCGVALQFALLRRQRREFSSCSHPANLHFHHHRNQRSEHLNANPDRNRWRLESTLSALWVTKSWTAISSGPLYVSPRQIAA